MIQDSEDLCAQCGTQQNAESNLTNTVFQVCNDVKCGHKFCSNCLDDLFIHQGKRQFACKRCTASGRQVFVRKDKLSTKSLMETEVEKDVRVRRKVKAIYNKTKDAFADAQSFRDYEEEVEDIIFNLVHGIDVDDTQARIKKYSLENEETIAFNMGKAHEDDQLLDKTIKEKDESLKRKITESRLAQEEERNYRKEHKRQENQLMLGERESINVTKESAAATAFDVAGHGASANDQLLANQQASLNHQSIFRLLNPRELPKATRIKNSDRSSLNKMKNEDKRRMHSAGGYDHTEWFRKSWREIVTTGGICNSQKPHWD